MGISGTSVGISYAPAHDICIILCACAMFYDYIIWTQYNNMELANDSRAHHTTYVIHASLIYDLCRSLRHNIIILLRSKPVRRLAVRRYHRRVWEKLLVLRRRGEPLLMLSSRIWFSIKICKTTRRFLPLLTGTPLHFFCSAAAAWTP